MEEGTLCFVCLLSVLLYTSSFLLLGHSLPDLEPEPSVFQGKPKTRCSLGIPQVFAAGLGKGGDIQLMDWTTTAFSVSLLWEKPLLDYLDLVLQANLINITLTFPYNYIYYNNFYCTRYVPIENPELIPWKAQLAFSGNSYNYTIQGFFFELAGEILQFHSHT